MYSHEISELLKYNNYVISIKDYIKICQSSQITKIKYSPFSNNYEVWTNDNYYYKFFVRKG